MVGNLFKTDVSKATVVTLYLLSDVNRKPASADLETVEALHAHGVARLRHGAGVAAGEDGAGGEAIAVVEDSDGLLTSNDNFEHLWVLIPFIYAIPSKAVIPYKSGNPEMSKGQ